MKKTLLLMFIAGMVMISLADNRRVLFIGDSITDGGWGRSGGKGLTSSQRNQTDLNHIYGHSFVYLCAAHYQSEYPLAQDTFFNRGISGNTLSDLQSRWKFDALDLHPNLISILIGTNDVDYALKQSNRSDVDTAQLNSFDFVDWEKRFRALIDSTLAQYPQLDIVLCTPFVAKCGRIGSADNYPQRLEMVKQCASIVRTIAADYDFPLVDYDQLFDSIASTYPQLPVQYWIWDGIHPTAAGHQRMADEWMRVVEDKHLLP